MENTIKCQEQRDGGASRIRGWHNYYDCTNKAKYKVTEKNGKATYLCGVHKNAWVKKWSCYIEKIEEIKEADNETKRFDGR